MARRRKKKLNKKVLILLIALGVLMAGGGTVVLLRFMPKDPVKLAARAEQAYADGELRQSLNQYRGAIGAAEKKGRMDLYVKYSMRYSEIAREGLNDKSKTQTQRAKFFQDMVGGYSTAVRGDPTYLEAHQELAEAFWDALQGKWDDIRVGTRSYVDAATELLEQDPNDHRTYFRRALAEKSRALGGASEHFDQVVSDFEKALELAPETEEYWLQYAVFLRQARRIEQVADVYARALDALPDSVSITTSYAWFLRAKNDIAEAREYFEAAIEKNPDNPAGFVAYGHFLLGQKENAKALEAANRAIELDPNEIGGYQLAGQVYRQRRDYSKMIECYRNAVRVADATELDTEDLSASFVTRLQERAGMVRGELRVQLASTLLAAVQLGEGDPNELMQEAKSLSKDIGDRYGTDSYQYAQIAGRIATLERRYADAIEIMQAGYEDFKRRHEGRVAGQLGFALAQAYLRTNKPGKAEKIADELRTDAAWKSNPMLHTLRAEIMISYRNYAGAQRALRDALQTAPDYQPAQRLLLMIRPLLDPMAGMPSQIVLDAYTTRLYLNEGQRMWAEGKEAEAMHLLEEMQSRDPGDSLVAEVLRRFYEQSGQEEKAAELIKRVSQANPESDMLRREAEISREPDPAKRFRMRMELADEIKDPISRNLRKAMLCRNEGKELDAYRYFEKAAELSLENPEQSDARAMVAIESMVSYALREDNPDLALKWLRRAGKANMDGADGKLYEARAEMVTGDYDKAIAILRTLLKNYPDAKSVYRLLGRCYLAKGDYDQAKQEFQAILENDPSFAPALIGMVRATRLSGGEEYVSWVLRAHKVAPGNPLVRSAYLQIQERQSGDIESMIKRREAILEKDEEKKDLTNMIALGRLYERAGRDREAERLYRFVYSKRGDGIPPIEAARLLGGYYARKGQQALVNQVVFQDLAKQDVPKSELFLLYGQLMAPVNYDDAIRAINRAIEEDADNPKSYRILAAIHSERNEPKKAADALGKFIRLGDPNPGHYQMYVRLLISSNQLAKASEEVERMLAQDSRDFRALVLKGLIELSAPDPDLDEARKHFSEAIDINPRYTRAYLSRANTYLSEGKIVEASRDLEAALRVSKSRRVSLLLASLERRMGNHREAEDIYQGLLQDLPGDPQVVTLLANLYLSQKQWDDLEGLLSKLKEQYPSSSLPHILEANMWARRDRTDRRIASLQEAMRIRPESNDVWFGYLRALMTAGRYGQVLSSIESRDLSGNELASEQAKVFRAAALAGSGKQDEADKLFSELLPGMNGQSIGLAVSLAREAYPEDAFEDRLASWIKARPDDASLRFIAAQQLLNAAETERREQALEYLQESSRLAKKQSASDAFRASVEAATGTVLYRMDRPSDAVAAYKRSLDIQPRNLEALNNLAYLLAEEGKDIEGALAYASQAMREAPSNPNILDTYGWCLAMAGRDAEARRHLEQAARIGDSSPAIQYHLGRVYEKLQNYRDARRAYRLGIELADDQTGGTYHSKLKTALDRVEKAISETARSNP